MINRNSVGCLSRQERRARRRAATKLAPSGDVLAALSRRSHDLHHLVQSKRDEPVDEHLAQ